MIVPPEWDEQAYLNKNQDVKLAVDAETIKSGYEHYLRYGIFEQRAGTYLPSNNKIAKKLTRKCFDPWVNAEISAKGELRPCCISQGFGYFDSIEQKRNNKDFRILRESLLTGNLQPMCQTCHIRSEESVDIFKAAVANLLTSEQSSDLLSSAPLEQLRIDINENCNLRCTYCAVSQPGYQGTQMTQEVLGKILNSLPKAVNNLTVQLNGHGETTFHPSWMAFAKEFQKLGAETTILSNFAKPFSEDEINILAHMTTIQISIDSLDENLLKNIRRKVSLGIILRNIHKIRIRAFKLNLQPIWSLSCGLYDKNIASINDLAIFAIRENFVSITFWNLVEYPDIEDNNAIIPRPLSSLSETDEHKALVTIRNTLALLQKHNVQVQITDELV